ncbi:zinc finger, CCHC-type, retrotransposon gag domain protein, partial [Tanacetum coccineum]
REMEGKGSGGSKQTPAKNPDAPVTKGELDNEIKRIMSEHLPTILAQSQKNIRKAKEARKATEDAEKKKKVNEEAERRRKAMEDKRAAEEQERKRNAEQARRNAEDAKRLRIKEAKRQRNTEVQRDGCTYKAFLNCNPDVFHRDSDPVIVTSWLKEIEDIFEISECSTRQRVKYASHLLKGEARHWWDMIKIAHGDDVAKAVELALMVEKENNRQLEEGGGNKRKRENRDDNMKKIKISGEKTENASEYKLCTICKKTHKAKCWHEDCRNCEKPGHATKDCKADWVYFRCKKPGHKIADCPERNTYDTQPQKTSGRVFQLTAKTS